MRTGKLSKFVKYDPTLNTNSGCVVCVERAPILETLNGRWIAICPFSAMITISLLPLRRAAREAIVKNTKERVRCVSSRASSEGKSNSLYLRPRSGNRS